MLRWIGYLSILIATASVMPVAHAQRNPLIARGQGEFDDLRFEEALQTLSAALVRHGNSTSEQATIYRLLAFTYLALGREEEASGAYRGMLPRAPDFVPGEDVAPRTREFFARVRTEWEAEGRPGTGPPPPVEIEHVSPAEASPGESVELTAGVQDPANRVAELVLAYRQGTDAVFTRVDTLPVADRFTATIPGEAVAPPLVEYYFEAVDSGGLPIAARGDVDAPLRIAVAGVGGGSVAEEWWFWTIIGVLAVGAGIGIGFAIDAASQPAGAEVGTLVITVE